MRILLLGTGAADGIPSYFSGSRVSEYARKHGGRDVRTRAAALIDHTMKVDFPPDTFAQCIREGIDPKDWTAIVFTHSDDDHVALREFQYSMYPFTDRYATDFVIYANEVICEMLEDAYPQWPLELVRTHSFHSFHHLGYEVTPIAANHLETEDSQNLIFEKDDKRILYATDTGYWHEPTWEFLAGVKLDCLVLECTEGFKPTDYEGHIGLDTCLKMIDRLRKQGTLSDSSIIATTHHSHNGDATYDELRAVLEPHGVQVGYDGMVLEV